MSCDPSKSPPLEFCDPSNHPPLEFGNEENAFIKQFHNVLCLGAGKNSPPPQITKDVVYDEPMDKSMELYVKRRKDFYPFFEKPLVEWTTNKKQSMSKAAFKRGKIGKLSR